MKSRIKDTIKLEGIYVIVDYALLQERNIEHVISQLLNAGITLFQYRDKKQNRRAFKKTAYSLLKKIHERNGLLIINDYPDIAREIGADGYHFGQSDLGNNLSELSSFSGVVGRTVRTVDEAIGAQKDGVDYIGAGALFPTTTKGNAPLMGLDRLHDIVRSVSIPVFGIGGITCSVLRDVFAQHVAGIALCSGVFSHDTVYNNAQKYLRFYNQYKKKIKTAK
ncbi:thiamine phosphate synthase [Chlamydiota bacterium]